MPWGETISDFVTKQTSRQDERRQRAYDNLLRLVGTGKDIWQLLQEENKYKPGSDYMKAQELFGKIYPQENTAYGSALEQRLYDYKRQHPEKTAEQRTSEYLMTPEGQAATQRQWTREDEIRADEHRMRLSEIAASVRANKSYMSVKDAYEMAISGVAELYRMPKDEMGNYQWAPGMDKESIRKTLASYADLVDPANREALKGLLNRWVDAGGATTPPSAGQTPPGGAPPDPNQIANALVTGAILSSSAAGAIAPSIAMALGFASTAAIPGAIVAGIYRIITGQSLIGQVPGLRDWINKQRPGLGDKLLPRDKYGAQAAKSAAENAAGLSKKFGGGASTDLYVPPSVLEGLPQP